MLHPVSTRIAASADTVRFQAAPAHPVPPLPAVRFGGDTLTRTQPSALSLTPNQHLLVAQIADTIETALAGRDPARYLQELESGKLPPLDIFREMVRRDLTVVGVPVPDKDTDRSLLDDPGFQRQLEAVLPAEQGAAMRQLAAGKGQGLSFVRQVGGDGYAMAQTLAGVEIAKRLGAGVGTFLGVNSGLAAEAIAKLGTPAQQVVWLNAMAEGKLTFAFGLTEETVGSDPRSMQTTFRRVTDPATGETRYRLTGNKKFIGNAARVLNPATGEVYHRGADFIVVFAVDDPTKPPEARSFRAFMVPRALIGEANIQMTSGEFGKKGLNEVNNGTFHFKDLEIPEAFMLGDGAADSLQKLLDSDVALADLKNRAMLGESPARLLAGLDAAGHPQALTALDRAMDIYPRLLKMLDETRLFVGAMSLGQAEAVIETARDYAAQRVQNGHAIEDFQAIAFPLDELAADALAGRLLVLSTARKVDEILKAGGPTEKFRTDTAMSKLFCSELAEKAAARARRTLGGNGYLNDPALNRGLSKREADAQVLTIYEGTSEIQRNLIAQGVMIVEGKALEKQAAASPLLAVGTTLRRQPGELADALVHRKSPVKAIATGMLTSQRETARKRMRDALQRPTADVVEAAYQFAVADTMLRYEAERKALSARWKAQGEPPEYVGWDADSKKRQLYLDASLAVQQRLHVMADMATDRRLTQLVQDELARLSGQDRLTPQEAEQKRLLTLFLKQAKDRAIARYHELNGEKLAQHEAAHRLRMERTVD